MLADLYQLYTRHAFEVMLQQSMYAHEVVGVWEKKTTESKFGGNFDLDFSKSTKTFDEAKSWEDREDDDFDNKIY